MKYRKGYKSIDMNGVVYEYAVSLATRKLYVYSSAASVRKVLDLYGPGYAPSQQWRGKQGDGEFGKREVVALIKAQLPG